jgi:hypothetical protein
VLAAALYGVDSGLSNSHRKMVPAHSFPDFVGPKRPEAKRENASRKQSTYGVTPRDAVLGYKVGWVPYS